MPRQHLIKIRSGTTTPLAVDFQVGEPAWDSATKRLYIKAGTTMAQVGAPTRFDGGSAATVLTANTYSIINGGDVNG